jgi:hypothetical protein
MKDGKEVSKRVVADWFPNLITNQGLDYLVDDNEVFTNILPATTWAFVYCSVGTGNTTPAFTDTSLANFLVHTTTRLSTVGDVVTSGSPYYKSWVTTFRFAEGDAAGNLAEVGVGWASNTLFSRALILDGVGSPTTITILSDEVLDVEYEYRVYPKETDVTGTVVFTGNIGGTYDYTIRAAHVDEKIPETTFDGFLPFEMTRTSNISSGTRFERVYEGSIGTILTSPSGTYDDVIPMTSFGTYTPGSFSLDITLTVPLTKGNLGAGIKSMLFFISTQYYQIEFDTAIPKTDTDVIAITFTLDWGRK